MPRFMLDTNSVSYALRGNPPSVREHLRRLPMAQVCISSITEAELLFGLALKPRPQSSPNSSINSSWASASCPGTPPLQKPTPTFAPCLGKRAAPSPPWTCSLPPTPSPPSSPSSPATALSTLSVHASASPTGPSPSKRDSPTPARLPSGRTRTRQLWYTSDESKLRVCAKKEIRNVLRPHLAIPGLRFTPFFLLNGFSRTEHGGQSTTGDRCSRPRHGRISRRPAHVSQHLEVHRVRSEREGRAIRLGERTMHACALPLRSRRVYERCSRRDGAPQRHRGSFWRSKKRA